MKLFLLIFLLSVNHVNFEEIVFIEEGELIEEFEENEYDKYYEKLNNRFFGWESFVIHDEVDVVFVSETLFSYRNQSNETISYEYTYETGKAIKDSIAVTGDIQAKADGKVKGFNLKFDSKIQSKISSQSTKSVSEKWELNIDVPPYTQVSLKIRGEGKLSNGVSKFFMFWMNTKKGGWEVLDVVNEYYWLVEEYV
ncbi:hypothetical protein RJG79_06410 [Mycoplasmatota bacterium WC44]